MIVFILTATDVTARVMTTIILTTMKGTAVPHHHHEWEVLHPCPTLYPEYL